MKLSIGSKITPITVHQRARWVHSGFIRSFDSSWPEWSWITQILVLIILVLQVCGQRFFFLRNAYKRGEEIFLACEIFIYLSPTYHTGKLSRETFHKINIKKILWYMDFLKEKSPRHRPRYSQQAWLRQDKNADPILRRLLERWEISSC